MPAFCLLLMLLNVCLLLLIVILPAADSLIVILFASDSLLLSVILPATAIERFKVWTESTMKIPMGKCAPRIYNNNWLPGSAATSTFWQTQKQIWNGRSMGQRRGRTCGMEGTWRKCIEGEGTPSHSSFFAFYTQPEPRWNMFNLRFSNSQFPLHIPCRPNLF